MAGGGMNDVALSLAREHLAKKKLEVAMYRGVSLTEFTKDELIKICIELGKMYTRELQKQYPNF
jgi:hypothetical protein